MPPKKKHSPNPGAIIGDDASAVPKVDDGGGVNKNLYTTLSLDLAQVLNAFPGIVDQDPLHVSAQDGALSGYQAIYADTMYSAAMKSVGKYRCGGNMMWVNNLFSAAPGIPMVETRIASIVQYYFQKPAPYPMEVVIAIQQDDFQPLKHKGGLNSISADEMRLAYFRAIARDVRAKRGADVMAQWRHSLLTVTMEFRLLPTEDDVSFAAINMREDIVTKYTELARSAYQRIHEIALFKARKEKVLGPLTHKRVAEEYNKHAKLAFILDAGSLQQL